MIKIEAVLVFIMVLQTLPFAVEPMVLSNVVRYITQIFQVTNPSSPVIAGQLLSSAAPQPGWSCFVLPRNGQDEKPYVRGPGIT